MELVLIESPYAGDIENNIKYARQCMRDSLSRGEAPYASHLIYTQEGILDDTKPDERLWGITAGLLWGRNALKTIVYLDKGLSSGMIYGITAAKLDGRPVEIRYLNSDLKDLASELVIEQILKN